MTKQSHSHAASAPWWNNPDIRAGIFQVIILSLVVYFGYALFQNTLHNLNSRGISSGFDFLDRSAGFEIDFKLIDFTSNDSNGRVFWVGLLNTLFVSTISIVCATVLGVVIGIARLSKNWLVAKIATIYVELFRNIPLLLQIFFWYFAVLRSLPSVRESVENGWFNSSVFLNNRGLTIPRPVYENGFNTVLIALAIAVVGAVLFARFAKRRQARTGQQLPVFWLNLGLLALLPMIAFFVMGKPLSWAYPEPGKFNIKGGISIIPELLALWFSLSIYTAAFIAEIVRAGIKSVNYGQTEAAMSLSLKSGLTMRQIILPQALRVIIPPLASQYLNIAKNSSLAAAIAYPDLVSVFTGTVLNNTGQALEVVGISMLAYLTISLSIAAFMNWYNSRVVLVGK